eukprot:CAMPEP_0182419010 /NCGR_PEP_ID=MMETSP1167-20130531/3396_1 /TAXON_ID=2988 /ORGANISM="Mallomonas Sp, Strain CCMP3275" /LENGTH=554 /DNA_ID=CAMNT_0024593563 /DNA_START=152 /DNA_END=1819 /DNA_ORIENTATION=+
MTEAFSSKKSFGKKRLSLPGVMGESLDTREKIEGAQPIDLSDISPTFSRRRSLSDSFTHHNHYRVFDKYVDKELLSTKVSVSIREILGRNLIIKEAAKEAIDDSRYQIMSDKSSFSSLENIKENPLKNELGMYENNKDERKSVNLPKSEIPNEDSFEKNDDEVNYSDIYPNKTVVVITPLQSPSLRPRRSSNSNQSPFRPNSISLGASHDNAMPVMSEDLPHSSSFSTSYTASTTRLSISHPPYLFNIKKLPKKSNIDENMSFSALTNIRFLVDGSNSNIFKANIDKSTPVIVKIVMKDPPNLSVAKKEFALEQRVLARISHANIVSFYGGGFDVDQRQFLVLERLNGGSLMAILNNKMSRSPFSFKQVLQLSQQFASALCYLHEEFHQEITIIHRDLKPDNIGFTDTGILKLMDFGLCTTVKRRTTSSEVYNLTGNTGSLRYMAPEVIRSCPYNEKVDIYSYGLILWQITTGEAPFQGLTLRDFYPRVVKDQLRPALSEMTGALPSFMDMVHTCWDHNNQERPSASEILDILRDMNLSVQAMKNNQCCECVLS